MLGRKQSVRNNEDWKNALDHIEETVSKKELDSLVKKTVKDIKEKCKGKKAAYAWSAGKDSLVLGEICEKAGIDQSVLVRCNLEYPAFIAWIEQNKPSGLEIINTGQDMEWLKKHPDMLFPDKSNKAAQWFHIVQHRGQARYYKEHQLEILLLGRRKADGNYVGKDNIYTNSAGITRYSPLAEWRHEDILAYIHYYDVKLPPIYDWEKGYLCGTHPWPARQYMETEQQGWKEVYDIDKTIVEIAAGSHCPSEMEDKMKVTTKKLSDLKHPEKNVRIHSEQQIRELKRSLEKFGQTRALVIDENNIILIGNGLYEAMASLGYQEATVYVKAGLSENDKKKLMIADNKTYALGIDNLETLNEFLEELQGDLDIPGYDEEILQQMVADADEVTEKLSEYGTLDDSEIQKIKEANKKREQKATPEETPDNHSENSSEKPNTSDNSTAEGQSTTEAEPEITETRRFVVCPKCGEKIWL